MAFLAKKHAGGIFRKHMAQNVSEGNLQEGRVVNTVRSDIQNLYGFTPSQRNQRMKNSIVRRVLFCQSTMCTLLSSEGRQPRASRGVNHDFIVVEVCFEDMESPFHVLAEKVGELGDDHESEASETATGIHVRLLTEPESNGLEKNIERAFRCNVRVELERVLDALEDYSPDYHILQENCWDYALTAYRKVLSVLLDAKDVDAATKKDIQRELGEKLFWSVGFLMGAIMPVLIIGTKFVFTLVRSKG